MEVNAPRVSMGRVCRFGAARSIVLSLLLASAGAPLAHHPLLAEGHPARRAVLHRPYCGTLLTPTARLRLRGGAAEAAMPAFRYVACESTPSRRDRARKRPEEEADDGIDDETLQKLMVIDEDRVQALLKDQTTAKKERRRRKRDLDSALEQMPTSRAHASYISTAPPKESASFDAMRRQKLARLAEGAGRLAGSAQTAAAGESERDRQPQSRRRETSPGHPMASHSASRTVASAPAPDCSAGPAAAQGAKLSAARRRSGKEVPQARDKASAVDYECEKCCRRSPKLSVRAAARTPTLTRQTCRFSSEAAAEAHERGCGSGPGAPAVEEKAEAASEASRPEDLSVDDAHESLSAWNHLQQVWRVRVCMHVHVHVLVHVRVHVRVCRRQGERHQRRCVCWR